MPDLFLAISGPGAVPGLIPAVLLAYMIAAWHRAMEGSAMKINKYVFGAVLGAVSVFMYFSAYWAVN